MKLSDIAVAVTAIVAGFAPVDRAFAWGQLGHLIVAELAQRHLTDSARTELQKFIGKASLASISMFADEYKFIDAGKGTKRWHYVDIDIDQPTYNASVDCPDKHDNGTCIVKGLSESIAKLKDKTLPKAERLLALKLVVHLAGDLVQPLHASERDGDGGGNGLYVALVATRSDGAQYKRASNFHSMWDDSLYRAASLFVV